MDELKFIYFPSLIKSIWAERVRISFSIYHSDFLLSLFLLFLSIFTIEL